MFNPLVDTDLIRTFVAVCDAGSFRAAAERVHRTPSAVSMQMAKLEEQVDAPLFRKEGRSMRLSHAGEEFLGYARRILSLHEEALARLHRPKLGGLVRFGVPDDYELRMLTAVLPRFARLCPDVEVEIEFNLSVELDKMVNRGELDLAFLESTALGGRIAGETVHAEPLIWLGAINGTAKERRPVPLALPGAPCHWRHTALDALERAGVPYHIAFTCQYSHGQVAALEADLAVSPLPASYRAPGLERIHGAHGLPELGTVSVQLCISTEADETARALADTIHQSMAGPATRERPPLFIAAPPSDEAAA
ncbi:MAG: LysR substrate-binding domain-containing protein [Acuticoccus sp.]